MEHISFSFKGLDTLSPENPELVLKHLQAINFANTDFATCLLELENWIAAYWMEQLFAEPDLFSVDSTILAMHNLNHGLQANQLATQPPIHILTTAFDQILIPIHYPNEIQFVLIRDKAILHHVKNNKLAISEPQIHLFTDSHQTYVDRTDFSLMQQHYLRYGGLLIGHYLQQQFSLIRNDLNNPAFNFSLEKPAVTFQAFFHPITDIEIENTLALNYIKDKAHLNLSLPETLIGVCSIMNSYKNLFMLQQYLIHELNLRHHVYYFPFCGGYSALLNRLNNLF